MHTIALPATVRLAAPGDPFPDRHALLIGDPDTGAAVAGTLDDLIRLAAEVSGLIAQARTTSQGAMDPPAAIEVDAEQLTTWAQAWVEDEFGQFLITATDVRHLVTTLNDTRPDGWRLHPDVKAVHATPTDDEDLVFSIDVTAGFRLCTTPRGPYEVSSDDLDGAALVVYVAEQVAGLLNREFAAYASR